MMMVMEDDDDNDNDDVNNNNNDDDDDDIFTFNYHSTLFPPVSMFEKYVECFPIQSDVVMNSLGVATGNLSIFMFFLILILAPLSYFLRKKVVSKPEYEIDEIQSASYALTVALMRIRDGKDQGIDPDGILVKLTREMQQLAQVDGISSSSSSSSSLPHIEMKCIRKQKDNEHSLFDDHDYMDVYDNLRMKEEDDHHVILFHDVESSSLSSSASSSSLPHIEMKCTRKQKDHDHSPFDDHDYNVDVYGNQEEEDDHHVIPLHVDVE